MQMYTKTGIGSGMKFISSRYGKTDTPSEEDCYDIFGQKIGTNRNTFHYYNPYIFIKSDTQDNTEFPTRGIYIDIQAKALDLFKDKQLEDKGAQISGNVKLNIKFSERLTYRVSGFMGVTFGEVPEFYKYRLGGIFEQNLGSFVSFDGYQFGQKRTIMSLELQIAFNTEF